MSKIEAVVDAADKQADRSRAKIMALLRAVNFILTAITSSKAVKVAHLKAEVEQRSDQNTEDEQLTSLSNLEKELEPLGLSPLNYFISLLFIDLISEIELYFANVIRIVVVKYPKKVGDVEFKLSEIMDASTTDELAARAADEFLYKLLYKKPSEYLTSMCSILSIDQTLVVPYWDAYVEAKARRDLGVHNDWKCNGTYLRKLEEGKIATTAKVGESLMPTHHYFNGIILAASKIVGAIDEAIAAKYGPPPAQAEP